MTKKLFYLVLLVVGAILYVSQPAIAATSVNLGADHNVYLIGGGFKYKLKTTDGNWAEEWTPLDWDLNACPAMTWNPTENRYEIKVASLGDAIIFKFLFDARDWNYCGHPGATQNLTSLDNIQYGSPFNANGRNDNQTFNNLNKGDQFIIYLCDAGNGNAKFAIAPTNDNDEVFTYNIQADICGVQAQNNWKPENTHVHFGYRNNGLTTWPGITGEVRDDVVYFTFRSAVAPDVVVFNNGNSGTLANANQT